MKRPTLGTDVADHVRVPIAARRSGRTIREIYELIDRGRLAAVRDGAGMVVVPEAGLDELDG